ncbi:MAG: tetratricopeptide repeat protein [Pirellulales bacterium]
MAKTFLYSLALAASWSVLFGGCASPTAKPPAQQTFMDKLGANVKTGTSKMAAAVMPKKTPLETPVMSPNGKPGPNLFVAVAQMHERTGKFDEAEANYRKALEHDSRHLGALVGYARLEDRRSNFEAATRLYRKAIQMHPKDASVHNDLGLCYHRRSMLPDATRELKRAVELAGENKLFRDNLAAVYVEQGKNDEALSQLTAAHGTSVGHYNLGYLLAQKGNRGEALYHFQKAAEVDGNLIAARHWVAKLQAPGGPYVSPAGGMAVAQAPPQAYGAPPQSTASQAYATGRTAPPPGQAPQYVPPANPLQPAPPARPPANSQAPRSPPPSWQAQPDPMPPLPNR